MKIQSPESLADASERSFIECYAMARTSSSRGKLRTTPEITLFEEGVGSRWVNGVLSARFTPHNLVQKVEEVITYFEQKDLPMTWYVGPSSTPSALGHYLLERGFIADWELRGMAIDPGDVRERTHPAELCISDVSDPDILSECIQVASRSYAFDEMNSTLFSDTYTHFGYGVSKRWLIGRLHGKPVASSLLILHEGLATIWLVATLPEARGQGIGSAMTTQLLTIARDLGHDRVVLQASETGYPVYKKLGFKEYCRIREYHRYPQKSRKDP